MEVFDFHCDTLYKSMMNDLLLDADIYELPLQFRDKPLIDYFIASAEKLISECKRLKITFNDINANKSLHLTVENSSFLEGNIENIEFLKKYGVKHPSQSDLFKVTEKYCIRKYGEEKGKQM
mgnify:CR=1 FL=1